MSGLEAFGAVAGVSQMCAYICQIVSSIQSRLEDIAEAPKIVRERQDYLSSLTSIIESIGRNRQLQTLSLEDHLTCVKIQIVELHRLLIERLRQSPTKSIQKFCRAWIGSKVDDKIHRVFLALEGAKSNLQLYISNCFGENTYLLLERFPKSAMPKESRLVEGRSKESRPKESRSKESRSKESRPKEGQPKDSRLPIVSNTPQIMPSKHDSRPNANQHNGQLLANRADFDSDIAARSKIEKDQAKNDPKFTAKPLVHTDGKLLEETVSNANTVYSRNVASGKRSKMHNGDDVVNPPKWYFEATQGEEKDRTFYYKNDATGDDQDLTNGSRKRWGKEER